MTNMSITYSNKTAYTADAVYVFMVKASKQVNYAPDLAFQQSLILILPVMPLSEL